MTMRIEEFRSRAMVGALAIAGFLVLLLPSLVAAQGRTAPRARSGSCQVDTTAEWYRSQRAFYSDRTERWSNDSLRNVLLTAAGYDANAVFAPELGWRLDFGVGGGGVDEGVVTLLRDMARKRQWPTRSLVGVAGVHAAWLIAQHDSALTVTAMHRMMEAGPGESSPAEVAILEDARRVQIGRGQIHGTQFRRNGAALQLSGHLEDSAHMDMRREGAWLPPYSVSACLAKAALTR